MQCMRIVDFCFVLSYACMNIRGTGDYHQMYDHYAVACKTREQSVTAITLDA